MCLVANIASAMQVKLNLDLHLDLHLVEQEMPSWTNCSLIDGSGIKLQQTGIKLQITGSNKVCNTALLPMLPLLLGDKWEVAGL